MNARQAENEKKLLDAIQELKDSIFGLKHTYVSYCFDYSQENGYTLNYTKLDKFAIQLSTLAKGVPVYDASFSDALPVFFRMCIMFLTAACNPNDWLFQSIKKIAFTVYKDSPDMKSTFDIMVEDSAEFLNEYFPNDEFENEHHLFNHRIASIDMTNFGMCIKLSLERFVDENKLNTLDDDNATQKIVLRLNRLSISMERALQVLPSNRGSLL